MLGRRSLGWIEVVEMNERLKNGLTNIGLVVLSVVVFFVILEGYLAVFDPQIQVNFLQQDEILGWENKPNFEGIRETREFKTHIKINSKGLRDENYDYKKPDGTKRIVVLGDSFTVGPQVEENELFTEVLENDLLKNVQVINTGVLGYGSYQELIFLKNEGVKYNPDLIVVAFYIENDILDNMGGNNRPTFVFDNNRERALTNATTNVPVPRKENVTLFLVFKKHIKKHIKKHFHSYTFISMKIRRMDPNLFNVFKKIGIVDKRTTPLGEQALKRSLELNSTGWNLTKAILNEIILVAEANNSKTMILIIPSRGQVNKNWDSEINGALVEFCKEENISVLDLLPEFREHAKNGEQLYFKIDGHWNAKGHKLAAELLNNKLIEEHLIPLGGEE